MYEHDDHQREEAEYYDEQDAAAEAEEEAYHCMPMPVTCDCCGQTAHAPQAELERSKWTLNRQVTLCPISNDLHIQFRIGRASRLLGDEKPSELALVIPF